MRILAERFALVAMILPAALVGQAVLAQAGKPAEPAKPAAKPEDQAASQLAKAWGLFYSAQKFDEAAKVLEPLTKSGVEPVRVEAVYLLGRCKLAAGLSDPETANPDKALAEAKKLWNSLSSKTLNVQLRRVQIIQALQLAADGKESDAAAILEKLLAEGHPATSTPESAIELAKVHAALGRMADARKALDFAAAFAKKLPAGGEIAQESVKPFIDHAEYLKKHLDPAAEAFAKAERLRIQKKFPEAIKAYTQVAQRHVDTDYAPRSEYSIGLCHLQAGKQTDACEHWSKFIAAASSGPWRGQAFLQLLDLNIADLNIDEAAKYATLAQNALPAALADDKAKTSWQPVAFSVGLRVGVIAYARKDLPAAAEAFEKVKAAAEKNTPKELIESIDRLIGYCKAGTDVIPSECRTGSADQKVATALGLGVIFNLCRQYELAEKIFTRIIGEPAKPAPGGSGTSGTSGAGRTPSGVSGASGGAAKLGNPSTEQLAFARFGRAVALFGRNSNEAKADLQESLKLFPAGKGSWQDEPLYCLAIILQNEAQAKFDREYKKEAESSNKPGQPTKQPTTQDRNAAEKAEKERQAILVKSLGETLPYWQDLVRNYPQSPRCEQALYYIGLVQYQIAENASDPLSPTGAAPITKTDQLWKDAIATFRHLCETFPKSPYAGDSYVLQMDINLERLFDWDQSQKISYAAMEWVDYSTNKIDADKSSEHNIAPWAKAIVTPGKEHINDKAKNIICRSSFILFAQNKLDDAKEQLKRLQSLLASTVEGEWNDFDRLKWGIEHGYLYAYPYELKWFSGQQRAIILLADFHYVTMDFAHSALITERLLAGACGHLSQEQASYVHFLRGSALSWLDRNEEALQELRTSYGSMKPSSANVTLTQDRAMYSAARMALSLSDESNRKWGLALLRELASVNRVNEFTGKAQIAYGLTLIEQGRENEGTAILENVSKTNPALGKVASAYLQAYIQNKQIIEKRQQTEGRSR